MHEILFGTEELQTETDDPGLRISSLIPKVPKLKKVCTDMITDLYCVVNPSIHSVRNPDVNESVSTGCSPVFNRLPNRFYCRCNKTQTKHTHEKCLAMRGLTKDRKVYWTCRTRSQSSISGCSFLHGIRLLHVHLFEIH